MMDMIFLILTLITVLCLDVPILLLTLLTILCCIIIMKEFHVRTSCSCERFPGPSGLPLLGNMHQINKDKPYITFTKWTEQFGDIFSLRFGSQKVVVINSIETAKIAMNDPCLSGRPHFYTSKSLIPVIPIFLIGFWNPLEVVFRWRNPPLQVSENYSDLPKWRSTILKYC